MGFIYKITNLINGKSYIGETIRKDPNIRWKQHLASARALRGCPYLTTAIRKHGVENFKFQVLIICFDEDRFIYEQQYIKKYNTLIPNGYNATECGRGGFIGRQHSEETKKKISQKSKLYFELKPEMRKEVTERCKLNSQKMHEGKKKVKEEQVNKLVEEGKSLDEATKIVKMSHSHFGKETSIEIKNKISLSLKKYYSDENVKNKRTRNSAKPKNPRILSDETKKKLSESMKLFHKDKDFTDEMSQRRKSIMASKFGKKINQCNMDGTLIATHESINEACRKLNVHKFQIQKCLKKDEKIAYGFKWEIVNP